MLFLESLNLEILVLLAGLFKDVNVLAAQVILVSFGQVLMTFPYGLSLASGVTVGHSVGANRPGEAKANCRMIAWINTGLSTLIILVMIGLCKSLIPIYAANNDDVISLTEGAFLVFLVAFLFDSS